MSVLDAFEAAHDTRLARNEPASETDGMEVPGCQSRLLQSVASACTYSLTMSRCVSTVAHCSRPRSSSGSVA